MPPHYARSLSLCPQRIRLSPINPQLPPHLPLLHGTIHQQSTKDHHTPHLLRPGQLFLLTLSTLSMCPKFIQIFHKNFHKKLCRLKALQISAIYIKKKEKDRLGFFVTRVFQSFARSYFRSKIIKEKKEGLPYPGRNFRFAVCFGFQAHFSSIIFSLVFIKIFMSRTQVLSPVDRNQSLEESNTPC